MVRIYDMKQKEVISTLDGSRLGYICDIEIDLHEGRIKKIIVPGPGKLLGFFGKDMEYQIPWNKIKKIGEDIILVDITSEDVLKESEY
ncbi:YlmC/YmxH family sporulation protein [Defluviitalea phaphyphila]|uniref:YlmC/YmxH family sporulation protein n=1 Tax=Defluviitalea phaphyphila TaxID=1473580 RepID=UPI000731048C|nr:YlmC/YmxH family sporulation protein [Defluviitalea phaphyphila]